jgi:hypothetical protein
MFPLLPVSYVEAVRIMAADNVEQPVRKPESTNADTDTENKRPEPAGRRMNKTDQGGKQAGSGNYGNQADKTEKKQ